MRAHFRYTFNVTLLVCVKFKRKNTQPFPWETHTVLCTHWRLPRRLRRAVDDWCWWFPQNHTRYLYFIWNNEFIQLKFPILFHKITYFMTTVKKITSGPQHFLAPAPGKALWRHGGWTGVRPPLGQVLRMLRRKRGVLMTKKCQVLRTLGTCWENKNLKKHSCVQGWPDQTVPGGGKEVPQRSKSPRERSGLDRREHPCETTDPGSAGTRALGNATDQGQSVRPSR